MRFEEFKDQYLTGIGDDETLIIAEEELLKFYNNRIPGATYRELALINEGENYEKLELFIIELSLRVLNNTHNTIDLDDNYWDELIVFREYFYRGVQQYSEKEIIIIVNKVISGLSAFNPKFISKSANSFSPLYYPFFVILFSYLLSYGNLDTVMQRILSPKFCACIDFPILQIPLLPHQSEAISKISPGCSGIIAMPPGTGKPIVALSAIEKGYYNKRKEGGVFTTLILVPSPLLMNQWHFDIIELLGLIRHNTITDLHSIEVPHLTIIIDLYANLPLLINSQSSFDLLICDDIYLLDKTDYLLSFPIPCTQKIGFSPTIKYQKIDDTADPVLFFYSLSSAIRDGIIQRFELVLYPKHIEPKTAPDFSLNTRDIQDTFLKINKFHLFSTIPEFLIYIQGSGRDSAIPEEWIELYDKIIQRRQVLANASKINKEIIDQIKIALSIRKGIVYCDTSDDCNTLFYELNQPDNSFVITSDRDVEEIENSLEKFMELENGILICQEKLGEKFQNLNLSVGYNFTNPEELSEFIYKIGNILKTNEANISTFNQILYLPHSFLDIDDAIIFNHQLSILFDLTLNTGSILKIDVLSSKPLQEIITKSEIYIHEYGMGREIPLPSGEVLDIQSIVSHIDIQVSEKLVNLLEQEETPIIDEKWQSLLRKAFNSNQINITNLRWLLLAGKRDPDKIINLLPSQKGQTEIIQHLLSIEESIENIDYLYQDIMEKINNLAQKPELLTDDNKSIKYIPTDISEKFSTILTKINSLETRSEMFWLGFAEKSEKLENSVQLINDSLNTSITDIKNQIEALLPTISRNILGSVSDSITQLQSHIDTQLGDFSQQFEESSGNAINTFIHSLNEHHNTSFHQLSIIDEQMQSINHQNNYLEKYHPQFKLGTLLYNNKHFEDAKNIFQTLIINYPDSHKAWYLLGITNARLQLFNEAERCMRNALLLDPNNEVYYENRKKIHERLIKENDKQKTKRNGIRKFWPKK